jgi:hypothetical protein
MVFGRLMMIHLLKTHLKDVREFCMQIDFHHATTWVVARAAGFSEADANIIAYASQYVDDATNYGYINFTNGAAYERVPSAHGMLDYKNLEQLKNMKVWVPFHFLPGNGGLPAGENPKGSFIQKLVCKPGSYVAEDMVNECIREKDRPYALHRLGITSHVFVDTWGHQGFAGVQHDINKVTELKGASEEPAAGLIEKVGHYFSELAQENIPSLGHGQALSNPDLPYESWRYTNGLNEIVIRNNPVDFMTAADELCKVYQRYIAVDPALDSSEDSAVEITGLSLAVKERIAECFTLFNTSDGKERHARWLSAIENDFFGLGAARVDYIPKGKGSWKHQALATTNSVDDDEYEFSSEFITSDWKYFHDAAKKHRLAIIDDILPRYGICVG